MKNRLCCAIRTPGLAEAALAVLLLLAFTASAQADAPPWLRTLAREPLPSYPAETEAVMLLDEAVTTVKDNGEILTTVRQAYKILRPQGRHHGRVTVHFDNETKLTFLKGWSIPAQGNAYEVKEKDAIERSVGLGDVYVDTRVKTLTIPGADPGSVVGWEYEQKHRPFLFENSWWLQDTVPVRHSRFTVRLPAGWEYSASWANHPPVEPRETAPNTWTWTIDDIPPIEPEPSMPALRAVAARLVVSYHPSQAALQQKSRRSWQDIGRWYAELTRDRRLVTPEVGAHVQQLTASQPDLLSKVAALARFAQSDVRYVSIQIGIGGYQPRPAASVFANRYGDCKDKATLLSAMLRAIGVESEYVLIHTSRGVVRPELPSPWSFNHVVLAIRLEPAIASGLHAVVDHPRLGKLLFFDPTDDMTPLGLLPAHLQANRGLLVTADGGELVELPLLSPERNQLVRRARLTLTSAGALTGEVEELRSGSNALARRAQLLEAPVAERPRLLERYLGLHLANFSLQDFRFENLDRSSDDLRVHYRFTANEYAKRAGNLLLVRPRVLGVKSSDVAEARDGKPRRFPVEFDAASQETDIFEIELPDGYEVDELPMPVEVDYSFAAYRSTVKLEGRVLRYQREFRVKDVLVPTERLAELKRFYRQVTADERGSAVLRRVAP